MTDGMNEQEHQSAEPEERYHERREGEAALLILNHLVQLERRTLEYLNSHGANIATKEPPAIKGDLPAFAKQTGRLQYSAPQMRAAAQEVLSTRKKPEHLILSARIALAMPWLWSQFESGRPSWKFTATLLGALPENPSSNTANRVTNRTKKLRGSKTSADQRGQKRLSRATEARARRVAIMAEGRTTARQIAGKLSREFKVTTTTIRRWLR